MSRSFVRTVLACLALLALFVAPSTPAAGEPEAGSESIVGAEETPEEASEEAPLVRTAEPGAENDLDDLETIITTGRRRSEFLQETPVSATVFGGSQLDDRGIDSLDKVGNYIPNLTTGVSPNHAGIFFSRGVGQRDAVVTLDPGVGLYIDDVYIARGQGAVLPTLDLERLEMLRGPQGTLYGKNTIGGALKLVTEKPGPEPMVTASFSGGTIGSMDTIGTANSFSMFNAPLIDDLLYSRFSFATSNNKGYTENTVNDQSYNDEHLLGTRGQFRLLPHEYLTLDLAGHYSRERDDSRGAKCRVTNPGTLGAISPFLAGACSAAENTSTYDFATNRDDNYRLDTYGTSLVADWELGQAFDLGSVDVKSISSWQQQNVDEGFFDIDATQMPLLEQWSNDPQLQSQISQEFQTSGTFFDDHVKLTSGLYGFWENTDGGNSITQTFVTTREEHVEIQNSSYAVYSQASYTPFSWMELSSGVRWTTETKSAHRTIEQGATPGEALNEHQSQDFNKWTPMAGVAFSAPDSLLADTPINSALAYFNYAQGYKSGGFSTRRDPSLLRIGDFEPEQLDNFEVGLKLDLLQNRLQFNTAFFYSFYEDIQLTVARVNPASAPFRPDVGSTIGNAGKAHIKGFEIETVARPIDALTLRTSIGLTDAKYDEFIDQTFDINPGTGLVENVRDLDRKNEPFLGVPDLSVDGTIEYALDTRTLGLPRAGTLTPLVHVYYQDASHYHYSPAGFESNRFRQRPYTLVDMRMLYDLPDDRTQMSLFVNNLLGTEYFEGAIDVSQIGLGSVYMSAPRTVGGEIRYNWSSPSWSEL